MIAISLLGLPMLVLGFEPVLAAAMVGAFLGGVGMEIFGLGWNLAMQEHVPDQMLSRAYSYDALGSFVAIPLGQLLFGPLGTRFGIQDVMLVSGSRTSRSPSWPCCPAPCGSSRASGAVSTTSQPVH